MFTTKSGLPLIITNLDKLRINKMGINAQQLHDHIVKPTLEYMRGNYYSRDAAFLMLCTAAIESNCGEYLKQVNGPALGIWQMEPDTHDDIWENCDACYTETGQLIVGLSSHNSFNGCDDFLAARNLIDSPKYACAMARLKYAMDSDPLPCRSNLRAVYGYYKRIYNTEAGASTWAKFKQAVLHHKILEVEL